jgi:facilitated trehalose transporter
MFFLPESPYWLLRHNRPDDAKKSLLWLRGSRFMKEELIMMEQNLKMNDSSAGISEIFKPSTLQPLIICASLQFFQQFCGSVAVFLYASSIFAASGSSIDSTVSSCIIGVVGIIGAFLTVFITDRAGRRVLLFISGLGMAISLTVFGIYYKIVETKGVEETSATLGWLPLVCLIVFVLMFWIGYGGIPWVILSEIVPPETKAIVGSITVVLNGCFGFIVGKFFSILVLWLQDYGAYWLFAGVCYLGLVYVALYVPETKGKSLQEITELFSSSKKIQDEFCLEMMEPSNVVCYNNIGNRMTVNEFGK